MTPVALTIAGSDPSGGAGVQADLKTFHQFGVYGQAVITLITVQNSRGVKSVKVLDPELVAAQIRAVIEDIRPSAAKIGAIGNREVAEAVADVARGFDFPLVVDPVMITKNGLGLAHAAAISPLLPHAFLLTPNLDEASALCGFLVDDLESMKRAGAFLLGRENVAKEVVDGTEEFVRASVVGSTNGPVNQLTNELTNVLINVLIKGGHLRGDAVDLLVGKFAENDVKVCEFCEKRIGTQNTHGTGCAYSAAITAELAKGTDLIEAIGRAKAWVTEAIRTNPGLGSGSGPLNFFAER